jgi:hypothetical protein
MRQDHGTAPQARQVEAPGVLAKGDRGFLAGLHFQEQPLAEIDEEPGLRRRPRAAAPGVCYLFETPAEVVVAADHPQVAGQLRASLRLDLDQPVLAVPDIRPPQPDATRAGHVVRTHEAHIAADH